MPNAKVLRTQALGGEHKASETSYKHMKIEKVTTSMVENYIAMAYVRPGAKTSKHLDYGRGIMRSLNVEIPEFESAGSEVSWIVWRLRSWLVAMGLQEIEERYRKVTGGV